jgi:uncharacterized protein (TIGR02246 family)
MNIEEMLRREAIRYTISRYISAIDRGKYEELADVFTPDGTMTFGGHPSLVGHDQIISSMRQGAERRGAFQPGNFQRHVLGHSIINVIDGRTARSVHYILVMSEVGVDHSGAYVDDFVKSGDRWLIAHRKANLEWVTPASRFAGFPGPNTVSKAALNIWEGR